MNNIYSTSLLPPNLKQEITEQYAVERADDDQRVALQKERRRQQNMLLLSGGRSMTASPKTVANNARLAALNQRERYVQMCASGSACVVLRFGAFE